MDALRLIRSRRVGPATFHRLLAEHGSPGAALAALPQVARAAGAQGYAPCPPAVARAELRKGRRMGAHLLRWDSPSYPPLLRAVSDAPPLLWVMGDPAALLRPSIAVIGARNASSLGLRMARGLARGLSEAGFVVTAGLARGIDAEAHRAALTRGTVAVLACGLDRTYPAEHADLAAQIVAAGGAVVSEYAFGTEPAARLFPARNRIVSGLSHATVVIEAAARSGSLITAKLALDQGREVMAVPGHPMDARASGCNALIRDGAVLVRHSQDVIDSLAEMGVHPQPAPADAVATTDAAKRPATAAPSVTTSAPLSCGTDAPPAGDALPPAPSGAAAVTTATPRAPDVAQGKGGGAPQDGCLHDTILSRLSPSPIEEDSLLRDLSLSPAQGLAALLDLELDGRITRSAGGRVALAEPVGRGAGR
ncbi:DNA-processing protein DprA [Paracoccus sp. p1-h21]|uniref:DNA-processing protein DprA n=1 Tax=unclassified Paracoccus (in: a-proteobacteria) TaxID=2688777 RepID=UPI0037B7F62B